MMTWKLWSMLKKPPRDHPLFVRVNKISATPLPRHINLAAMSVLVVMICFLVAIVPPLLPLALLLPVMFALFSGSVYGLVWAARVSRTIVHEHEQRTFEILSIAPDGALGATWAIGTGCIHRSGAFDSLKVFSLEEFCIAWIITLIMNANRWQYYLNSFEGNGVIFPVLALVLYSLMLIVAFYFNNIQSVIIGTLVGMSIPIFARSRLDAQLWSVGIYLLLQSVTYLLTGILIGVVVPSVVASSVGAEILLAFLSVGIFYLTREIVIASLWRLLVFRLNSQYTDIQKSFGL